MTECSATPTTQAPGWRLLAEFSLPPAPGRARVAAERAAAAVRELDLQPTQVELIHSTVEEAACGPAKEAGDRDRPHVPLSVRVWISDTSPQEPRSSAAEAAQAAGRSRRSWGFFTVEKQGPDLQDSTEEPRRAIEVYLYEERGGHLCSQAASGPPSEA